MEEASAEKGADFAKCAPVGRAYRMTWWFRGFAILFLAVALTLAIGFVRDLFVSPEELDFVKILIGTVFPIVGSGIMLKALTSQVSFSENSIERGWIMRRQSLPLAAIRGRREYVARGGEEGGSTRYLRLESNDGSAPLDFGKKLYVFDDAFWQWFNQLPDLDARDKEVHKDSNFGLI